MSLEFVSLSLETANHMRSSACSIGMVKVLDGEVTDRFFSLIKPAGADGIFSSKATAIHGITAADVQNAPYWVQLASKVSAFIGDHPVAMHKKESTLDILMALAERHHFPYPTFQRFSTPHLTKWVVPGLTDHALRASVEALAVDDTGLRYRHAADDALMAALVVLKAAEKIDADSIAELTNACRTALTTV